MTMLMSMTTSGFFAVIVQAGTGDVFNNINDVKKIIITDIVMVMTFVTMMMMTVMVARTIIIVAMKG